MYVRVEVGEHRKFVKIDNIDDITFHTFAKIGQSNKQRIKITYLKCIFLSYFF